MYTELHLHTSFSFLDGASQPDELLARAQELGYTDLAITDHDGVYGAMEFSNLALTHNINPITGAEITLSDGSHILLLAENQTGYGNLCRLLTQLHHGNPPPPVHLDHEQPETNLGTCAEGLILLTGCRNGQLAQLVDARRLQDARRVLQQYVAWFGSSNVFVELQQNFVFGDTQRIDSLVRLANDCGVRYVATGNVHYHRRARHRLQDVLVAIKHTKTLDACHRERRPNAEFYLRSPDEMERIFQTYPEAIRSTELIAKRCRGFVLATDLHYQFPDYETGTGETPHEHLTRICGEMFATRYAPEDANYQEARERMQEELRLIAHHNLSGFFLIYRDLLDMGRDIADELRGRELSGSRRFLPPGRGRGSSVSSIVCYLIGLSPVDPMRHDLYVGRFLNEDLPSIPDIDIDFPREIREKMIERVYQVYGAENTALVCTFATYRLRSAVRDIGKTLGIPLTDLDRISRLSEPRSARHLAGELERLPEFASRTDVPPWSYLIDLADQLAGFPRHISQHPGGMIISASTSPLNRLVPIQPATMEGRFICQWDKDSCEDARFIKIDFLALGMLSLVEECLDRIDEVEQLPVDLSQIDYDDPHVYEMIREGDTIGVFQIESRAQIQMLRRTLPTCLDDIVVQVAIVRPGPIVGGAVTPYVRRKEDPNYEITYDHPVLEPILKDTLGVMLYQEQVVQVAEAMAGFSAGQADQLRRAMTRKRSHESMEALRETFIAGAVRTHGVSRDLANGVFQKLAGFADYGFPKSHAAAFGLLAYQSCWLRYYYPAEFMCALLNNQPMGFYAPHVLINDAKRHGLAVLRPDINLSDVECSVEGKRTIRIGLSFVKGLGTDVAQAIVDERERNGAFTSLANLVRRVAMRPDAAQNLIAADALEGFGLGRREMLWQLGLFIPAKGFGSTRSRKARGKQLSLPLPTTQDHVSLKPMRAWERMTDEYRVLGLSPQWHPMGLLREHIRQNPDSMHSSADIAHMKHGMPIRIPGLVVCRQRPGTAKGITFLLLEDEFGLVNVIVYPDLYERQRLQVRSTPLLIVEGTLQLLSNNVNVIAHRLVPIDNMQTLKPFTPEDMKEDPWVIEEAVDVRTVAFPKHEIPLEDQGPISRAELIAVAPEAHSYR